MSLVSNESQSSKAMKDPDLILEAKCLQVDCEDDAPWCVCVTHTWGHLFSAQGVFEGEPTATNLWEVVCEALDRFEAEGYTRPKWLKARKNEGWEQLKNQLKAIDIALIVTRSPVDTERAMAALAINIAKYTA